VDEEIDALSADPDLARPHRLCPRLAYGALARPFVWALQTGDADLLGVLTRHPCAAELLDQLGPAGLMDAVLPVWRKHRLARTDWPLDEQAYALHALMAGFLDTATRATALRGITVEDPEKVMAAAVTTLLGPEQADPADVRATAEEGLRLLQQRRETVLATITSR
jgi:hypothetical protein